MSSSRPPLLRSAAFLAFVCGLFGFSSSAYQSLLAHQTATETSATYRPDVEQQAIAEILKSLPQTEEGARAAFLAKGLGSAADGQYLALSRAVNHHASHTLHQAISWAAVSMLAGIAVLELRRKSARDA